MNISTISSKPAHRSGFTLIELLVVMAIIATLAAIGFGVFYKARNSSKEKETRVLLGNIKSNFEAVKAETGVAYPDNDTDLIKYLTGDSSYFTTGFDVKPAMPSLLEGNAGFKFVKDGKLVDSWKREIEYTVGKDEDGDLLITLKSKGIDKDKPEDDIEVQIF